MPLSINRSRWIEEEVSCSAHDRQDISRSCESEIVRGEVFCEPSRRYEEEVLAERGRIFWSEEMLAVERRVSIH